MAGPCGLCIIAAVSYRRDLGDAARRHKAAADRLREPPQHSARPDVAAYLDGLAAECALKEIMWQSGMRPTGRSDDPFYLHFPAVKAALRDQAQGRQQGTLAKYAGDPSLMNEWDITMRYAHRSDVLSKPLDRWKDQAAQLLRALDDL